MTSSEPPGDGAAVLARGHLHPGVLFLRFADGLRQSILPVVIAIVAREPWLAVAAAVFFVIGLIFALARYLSFQYRLTEEELVTTEGILHRQERRIPVDRIQDLNFESTLLRRMFRLVVVSVETASGQGAEARLDSLSQRDAARLRDVLYALRTKRSGVEADAAEPPEEALLFRSSGGELTLLGLTNNRIGAVLVAIVGVVELTDQLGFGAAAGGVFGSIFDSLAGLQASLFALLAVAMFFLFLMAGWLLSVTASVVMYHGFTLTERDEILYRRYGLITTRAQSLPKRKIQRVTLESPLMRRLVGTAVVRADSAGSSSLEQRGGSSSERDVIVPLTQVPRAEALVPWLIEGASAAGLPWRRVSPRVVTRIFSKGVLFATAVLAVGLPTVGLVALLGLIALPLAYGLGALAYSNLAYARIEGHVAFRWGIIGRYRAVIPLRKVQGVVLRAGPIERFLRLAHLTVFVAGGSPTTLGNLPREEAEELVRDVAGEAARSRFVW